MPASLRRLLVTRVLPRASAAFLAVCCTCLASPLSGSAQSPAKPVAAANELDAFMEKVLKRREVNRKTLEQYVLDEDEQFEVLGPTRMPVYRHKREFTWYVRDGIHVRSPVKFDGVTIGEDTRKEYEDRWAKRERARLEQAAKREKERAEKSKTETPATADPEPAALPDDLAGPSGASPIPTPRFVSEAYFMDFKFEAGSYYLAGREQLEGQQVLRIEYYPKRMFNDNDDDNKRNQSEAKKNENNDRQSRAERREREMEQRIERQMNKTALVTLWVDPAEHQIVKYTFDNVWMDFLPGGWLVKVDDIRASMTMGQPFKGVWLPREMNIHAGVTVALGSLEASYDRRFSNYKQAETSTKITIPKRQPPQPPSPLPEPIDLEPHGPFASDDPQAEVVSEVRVHGNAYLRDDEVLRLAGITVGQTLGPDALREIEQRLAASHHFETIEVRKRYRSLESTTDVALILLVHEKPGLTSETIPQAPRWKTWAKLKKRMMFLPILDYDDGYGFTYGGRVSTIGLLGAKERLSVPATWGGTRRIALEVERTFKAGPLSRVESTVGIWQRENPRFEIDDQRVEWSARAERSFAGLLRTGVGTSVSTVEFGGIDDRLSTIGADVALDTRGDPAFPRNAVLLGAGWTALRVKSLDEPINRYTTEARGFLGVIRQAVLAGRVQYSTSDRTLPPYERLLLGGSSNLRGFTTGTFDGDRLFVTSAELRVPITSVLSGAKLGVTAFMDASKVFDVGQKLKDAPWHQGVGAGVFMIATIVRINLDLARGLKTGDTRVHLSSGFSF
jgi:Omp85 superfamily domain